MEFPFYDRLCIWLVGVLPIFTLSIGVVLFCSGIPRGFTSSTWTNSGAFARTSVPGLNDHSQRNPEQCMASNESFLMFTNTINYCVIFKLSGKCLYYKHRNINSLRSVLRGRKVKNNLLNLTTIQKS